MGEHCQGGIVVHTGAGISAAAGIQTYREGGEDGISIEAALPTYAHYALLALMKAGMVRYVCSQNVDGLHRRSGIPANRLSELHGNCYIETCRCCNPRKEFLRPYPVRGPDPARMDQVVVLESFQSDSKKEKWLE